MTDFVLDNSVVMRWLLESERTSDQKYAENVLKSMVNSGAMVPNLWQLEVVNVLVAAESRCDVSLGEMERFLSQLENLPINTDSLTARHAFSRTLALARAYTISSYDAAYLELAIRAGLPLASLDKKLIRAAKKTDVRIYLK
jgi:predicted nucleic acid-binding protein